MDGIETPDQALRLIDARYFSYQAAMIWREAAIAPAPGGAAALSGSGNYPAWAEAQRRLDELLAMLEDLFKARERVRMGILPASKETKGDLRSRERGGLNCARQMAS